MRARLCRHSLESASSQSEAVCDAHCVRSVHAAGRTPSYWPYDQVVTECLILRPRAMQVINCAAWHGQQRRQAVARRDSMAASRRIPMKTSKKSRKNPQKIGACGGPWDPISPPHGYPLGPSPPPRVASSVAAAAPVPVCRESNALCMAGTRVACYVCGLVALEPL